MHSCYFWVMRFILFLTILASGLYTRAQSSEWGLGLLGAASLEYRYLISDGSSIANQVKAERDANESLLKSFRTGGGIHREIGSNITLATGLIYSSRGYSRKLGGLGFEDQIDPVTGFNDSSSTSDAGNHISRFNYLEVPISAYLRLEKNRIDLMPGIGFSLDYLLSSTEQHQFRKFNLSPHVKLGVRCNVSDSQYIMSEMYYRLGVVDLTDTPLSAKLWSSGIQLGYFWRI